MSKNTRKKITLSIFCLTGIILCSIFLTPNNKKDTNYNENIEYKNTYIYSIFEPAPKNRIKIEEAPYQTDKISLKKGIKVPQYFQEDSSLLFNKALLINPTYDLIESITRIDELYDKQIPLQQNNETYNEELKSALYLNEPLFQTFPNAFNLFFKLATPILQFTTLERIIGLYFRYHAINLIFPTKSLQEGINKHQSSVYIKLKKLICGLKVMNSTTIESISVLYSSKTEDISARTNLKNIEEFLRKNQNVYLMHNKNDYILKKGDIKWFKDVFKERAKIFPTGGHCGNLKHKDFADHLIKIFKFK